MYSQTLSNKKPGGIALTGPTCITPTCTTWQQQDGDNLSATLIQVYIQHTDIPSCSPKVMQLIAYKEVLPAINTY